MINIYFILDRLTRASPLLIYLYMFLNYVLFGYKKYLLLGFIIQYSYKCFRIKQKFMHILLFRNIIGDKIKNIFSYPS